VKILRKEESKLDLDKK